MKKILLLLILLSSNIFANGPNPVLDLRVVNSLPYRPPLELISFGGAYRFLPGESYHFNTSAISPGTNCRKNSDSNYTCPLQCSIPGGQEPKIIGNITFDIFKGIQSVEPIDAVFYDKMHVKLNYDSPMEANIKYYFDGESK